MWIKVSTDELVSVANAAKTLGWPKMRVYRWVNANRMIGINLGGILLVLRSEVDRLKNKTNEAQAASS